MTGIEWVRFDDLIPTDEEQARIDAAKAACLARHGGHLWLADLGDEYEDYVGIRCAECPASVDDLYPDAGLSMQGEVRGVQIEDGYRVSGDGVGIDVPVTLTVHSERYPATPAHGEEWDVWVEIAERVS